jgi:signal peptidase I
MLAATLIAGCGDNRMTVVVRTTEPPNNSTLLAGRVYRVPSGSMEPTLSVGARVVVEPGTPQVGEIVVFHPPKDADVEVCGGSSLHMATPGGAACVTPQSRPSSVQFIKRIVAGPGDTLYIKDGHAYRDGKREEDSYIRKCGSVPECNFPVPIKIPSGHWFLMGDNRGESDDSRFWGPVPTNWITGIVRLNTPAGSPSPE